MSASSRPGADEKEPLATRDEPVDLESMLFTPSPRRLGRLPRLLRGSFSIVRAAAPRALRRSVVLQLVVAGVVGVQLLALRELLGEVLGAGDVTFWDLAPALAALVFAHAVSSFAAVALSEQQRLVSELTARHCIELLVEAASRADLVDFERPSFHDQLLRATINASSRPTQMVSSTLTVAGTAFAVAGLGVGLLLLEPVFAVLVLAGFAPGWFATVVASRTSHRFQVEQARRDRQLSYIQMLLLRKQSAKEVRAYDLAPPLKRQLGALYDERIADVRDLVRRRTSLGLAGSMATALLTGATIATMLWFATSGRADLASAGAAIGAVVLLVQRLQSLQGALGGLYESSLFIEDFTGFVAEMAQRSGTRPTAPIPEHPRTYATDAVSFRYPTGTVDVLTDVSIRVAPGEVVAIVGENGSGKTTLAKILAGLFPPTAGAVVWDGQPLSSADPAAVRDRVAVLFQDFGQFHLTLGDNIRLGRWEVGDGDGTRLAEAAERAGLTALVGGLPAGFDTALGPELFGGLDLSGGQWQKLALARALYRQASLVILDEPTASLDPRAEAELFQRMRHLYEGAAVLLISHRFSSVRSADRIYVLDGGRVAEQGDHATLMASGGIYAELFTRQASGYLDPQPS